MMKRALVSLAASVLLCAPGRATCGDADGDTVVNILDALVVGRSAAGLVTLTPEAIRRADVDADLAVTILDALQIAQASAGMPASLVCPTLAEKVYVASSFPDELAVFDLATGARVGTVALPSSPVSLTADPVRDLLYVTDGSSIVRMVDTVTDALTGIFVVPGLAGDVDISPDGSTLVGLTATGVVVVDMPAHTVRTNIATGSPLSFQGGYIAASPDGLSAWTSDSSSNEAIRVDLVAGTVAARVPVGYYPFGIDISPSGGMVFVINHGDETLSRIDTTTNQEVLPRQPVGTYPMGVLAHSNGSAYAVNCISWNVTQHAAATGSQTGVFGVGQEPTEIDQASTGELLVVNTFSSFVTVVDISTGGTRSFPLATSPSDVVSK